MLVSPHQALQASGAQRIKTQNGDGRVNRLEYCTHIQAASGVIWYSGRSTAYVLATFDSTDVRTKENMRPIDLKFEIVTVMTFAMTDDSNKISKGFPPKPNPNWQSDRSFIRELCCIAKGSIFRQRNSVENSLDSSVCCHLRVAVRLAVSSVHSTRV